MNEAALGLKVDASGVLAATKSLEDFAAQGPKVEKSLAGVEGASEKTGKSLKTLGDSASKGLGDVGKSAPPAAESIGRVTKSADEAKRALDGMNASVVSLGTVVKPLAAAFAGLKLADLAKDATMLAARYETMGVVMGVAGNNAGYTRAQMEEFSKSLQQSGISMLQSRNSLTQLATAHIDLSNAAKLGRAAQDLAVVGNINSSEALERMIHGIKSGEVEILRTLGLNVRFEDGYKKLAQSIGVSVDSLTEQQKVLARTNEALDAAAAYAGIYEESMTTAGKAITSLTRYWEDLKVKAGDAFLPTLTTAVFDLTEALKAANAELSKAGREGLIDNVANALNGTLKTALQTVSVLGANVAYVFQGVGREMGGIAAQAAAVARLDFAGAASIRREMISDNLSSEAALKAFEDRVMGNTSPSVVKSSMSEQDRIAAAKARKEATENAQEEANAEMAIVSARMRLAGITKQYFADLKAGQDALKHNRITEAEYIKYVSDLAKRTWDSSTAGKDAAKKTRAGAAGAARINRADLASDITDIQLQYRLLTTASGNAERLLDAQRAAGLVSEREYYAQKRKFVEDNAALQIRELEDENKRYAQQAATGADKINNEKKIAQNTAKMAEIRAKADTDIKISTLQQEEANRQLEASYKALEQSMAGYLKTSADRYQRELQGMGLGNQWRDQNAAANQINDRYESQRNDLRNNRERLELEKKWNSDLEEQYQRRLEIINDANQKALGLDADYWRRRLQMQQDWTVGASEALTNYLNDANNTAALTEKAFTNGISGMEDALVSFVTTGKLSFTQLANSIVADITRIIIKQQLAAAIGGGGGMNWLGGLVGGLFGTSGTAAVANVLPGNPLDNLLNLTGNFVANAKGGVYDSPNLSMYSNQVHSTPKVFAFAKGAGVFAEAGPEAIMPLTRNSAGVLGVRAVGGNSGGSDGGGRGGDRVYNINVQTVAQPGMSRATALQQGADYGRGIQRALERNG